MVEMVCFILCVFYHNLKKKKRSWKQGRKCIGVGLRVMKGDIFGPGER